MKTFQQWSSLGYKIIKGSKGIPGDKGTWWFTENQVVYSPRKSYYSNINLGDHKGMDNPHWDYRYDGYLGDDYE